MERNLLLKTLGSQRAMEVVLVWKKLAKLGGSFKLCWHKTCSELFFRAVYFLDCLINVRVSSDVVKVGW